MKRITVRIIAAALSVVLLTSVLAGCGDNEDGADFVFLPEFITLPEEIFDIQNLTYANNMLYFSSTIILDRENYETTTKLFSMNLDGTNITELTGYVPLSSPRPDAQGGVYISSLTADPGGDLWIVEMGNFYVITDNTPDDFDGDEWERDMYLDYEHLGNLMQLRKLDNTGTEILSIDLEQATGGAENTQVSSFAMDGSGNIYLGIYSYSETDFNMIFNITVLNSEGNLQFRMDLDNWIDTLIRLPDGDVAYVGWEDSVDGYSQVLRKIDFSARDWGETIELPGNIWGQMIPGGGDYLLFYQDQNNLNGVDAETGESVRLINWIESGIMPTGLNNIVILPDGRIICTNMDWGSGGSYYDMTVDLLMFTKTPISQLPVRTEITLATVWLNWDLRNAIINFNRTSQTYRIKVTDYSEFNTDDDWSIGLTRLTTDIIAGNIPDILDLDNMPFHQYVARGLLVDFYPLIDSDPELNRSDFMESVFRTAEVNGGLYRMFPSFYISTLVGSPDVLGPQPGWNMEEFIAVLNANPQADIPLGQWLTRDNFFLYNVILNLDQYINWATGEVFFNTGEFAQLLEFSTRFPDSLDYDNMEWFDENELVATGRQIVSMAWIQEFSSIQNYIRTFGGEVVYKGFPTESRRGSSLQIGSALAITSSCKSVEGAWEFLRIFLTADWQRENISWMFPTNKTIFNEMVERAMTAEEDHYYGVAVPAPRFDMPGIDMWSPPPPLTQAEINQVIDLIESVSGIVNYEETLINIIQEGAQDFFSGRGSAQDAARVIQNRVSIYIAEQS